MRPGRSNLNNKSDEELTDIVNSRDYTVAVRADARGLLLARGVADDILKPLDVIRQTGDTRKPVLYLRPFAADERFTLWYSYSGNRLVPAEPLFLKQFESLGPVIAVGHPADGLLPEFAATRLYATAEKNNNWQRLFRKLLDQSGYVVLFGEATESLNWEINQVFRRNPFIPTFLLMPFFDHPANRKERRERMREAMAEFKSNFQEVTGIFLDHNLDGHSVIYFPERGKPQPSPLRLSKYHSGMFVLDAKEAAYYRNLNRLERALVVVLSVVFFFFILRC
jgi:hypothetical protein